MPSLIITGEIPDRPIIIAYSQLNIGRLVDVFKHLKLPRSKDWGKLKVSSAFE
jgi:hypothetical protein